MHPILVAGAGKIGRLIACMLAESGDYKVFLSDLQMSNFDKSLLGNQQKHITLVDLDATDQTAFSEMVSKTKIQSVICALPFFCNVPVAQAAKAHQLNYFDLTEDTKVTDQIIEIAMGAQSIFAPQCGLAPGFISIVAHALMTHFDEVESVLMRVGALPQRPNNALKYALNWSTEGIINEYGNPCFGIHQGKITSLLPLEGLESVEIDGLLYEAFNTSGGLGSLAKSFQGKVQTMNYKTLRYPGHCQQMRLLMNDLKLNQDRKTLQRILETAIPKTFQDVVLVYVAVKGRQNGEYLEETYLKKIYPQTIANRVWSAIQVSTAGSVCAVLDKVVTHKNANQGILLQEQISLSDITENRFGQYYAQET